MEKKERKVTLAENMYLVRMEDIDPVKDLKEALEKQPTIIGAKQKVILPKSAYANMNEVTITHVPDKVTTGFEYKVGDVIIIDLITAGDSMRDVYINGEKLKMVDAYSIKMKLG